MNSGPSTILRWGCSSPPSPMTPTRSCVAHLTMGRSKRGRGDSHHYPLDPCGGEPSRVGGIVHGATAERRHIFIKEDTDDLCMERYYQ